MGASRCKTQTDATRLGPGSGTLAFERSAPRTYKGSHANVAGIVVLRRAGAVVAPAHQRGGRRGLYRALPALSPRADQLDRIPQRRAHRAQAQQRRRGAVHLRRHPRPGGAAGKDRHSESRPGPGTGARGAGRSGLGGSAAAGRETESARDDRATGAADRAAGHGAGLHPDLWQDAGSAV